MQYLLTAFYIGLLTPACLAAIVCPSSDLESLLLPGRDYSYTFHGKTAFQTPGSEEDGISLLCEVAISHVKYCKFGLRIHSCLLSESSQTEGQTLDHLSKYPVLFSLVDGEIVEVNANEDEPLHALNIKRGILSAFIFKLSQTKRASQSMLTDIQGTCPVTITPSETTKGYARTSRDLLKCKRTNKKEGYFNLFSNKISIDSTISCSYDINQDERRLNHVNCTEKHSSDTVLAKIYYNITYKSSHLQKERNDFSSASRRVGIQYEQEELQLPDTEEFERVAQRMLWQLVEHSSGGIGLSTLSEYTNLVTWLKSARSSTSLLKALEENNCLMDGVGCLSRKEIGMSYFVDALMQCTSVPCIEAISHLVKTGKMFPPDSMYRSWSKLYSPDPAVMKHIKNICQDTDSKLCWTTFESFAQKIYTENLEIFKAINPYHNGTSGKEIYEEYSSILLNSSFPTNTRIMAYDQIPRVPQNDKFGNIILTILKTEEDLQLKSHIARSLKTLLRNTNITSDEKRFTSTLYKLLKKEEISLNRIIHEAEAKYTTKRNFTSMDFSHVLQDIITFGFELLNSSDFADYDIFLQLIRKLAYIVGFEDVRSKEFETWAILLQEFAKEIEDRYLSFEKLFGTLQRVLEEFEMHSKPLEEYNLSETILTIIKKFEEMHRKYKPESKTFFNRVSYFVGNTWHYISSGEIFHLPSRILEMHTLLKELEKGLFYNATKMFRIMESHQKIPTMMGLPLRWDSSAVMAFSLRTGLKLERQTQNLEGYFQPSAAFTYLNGMVIDLPSVMQVGVQANRSIFASVEWKAKLTSSEERTIFSFHRPSRLKNSLQFFHTHQLMKQGAWYDEESAGRETLPTCTEGLLSSILGFQFCVMKSRPESPNSNYRTWQLFFEPSDREIETYDVEILRSREMVSGETTIKYSTPGSKNTREIFFIIINGNSNGEMQIQVKIPVLPHFNLRLESLKGAKNYKTVLNLTLQEGRHYGLIYKVENDVKKSDSDDKKNAEDIKVQERLFSFVTPFSNYSVNLTNDRNNGIKSTRIILSYNSYKQENSILFAILPQSLWETDNTAWLKIQIIQNLENTRNPQNTVCIIEDPQTTTLFSTGSLNLNGVERKYISATKRQSPGGKLLAVAYFTYDFWSPRNDSNEIQRKIFNLTIARQSWAVEVLKEGKGGQYSYEVALTRIAVMPEGEKIYDYDDWCSVGCPRIQNGQRPLLKLSVDVETHVINNQELAQKYSTVNVQELPELWNQLIEANLSFQYPNISGYELVKAGGYFIASGGPSETRFQNNFEIESSYHNLHLTSHSVYRSGVEFTSLHHNSCLTHLPTDKKAFHSVHFWLSTPAEGCTEAEFKHNILSRVFDLSTLVTYKCKPDRIDLHDLRLNLQSNSSDWNMLNLSISQLVENQMPEYTFETCNVTHPLLIINVTADWVGKMRDHKKRVLFTCREENSQSTELLIQYLHDGKMTADLLIPDGSKRRKLSFGRTISSDAKTQNCKITFTNDEYKNSEGLHLIGEILNDSYQIWNLKLHLNACAEIYSLLRKGYQNVLHHVITISKDVHHPVNKIFLFNFKATLYEYFEGLHKQGNDILTGIWKNLKGAVHSLQTFYEMPVIILSNMMTYFAAKQHYIVMPNTNYFNFSSYFYTMKETIWQFLKPKEEILEWEFVTSRIIKLESFNEWPSVSLKEINFNPPDEQTTEQPLTEPTEVASSKKEAPTSACLGDGQIKLVSCEEKSIDSVLPEHSDSYHELTESIWSKTTRSRTCPAKNRKWWQKQEA